MAMGNGQLGEMNFDVREPLPPREPEKKTTPDVRITDPRPGEEPIPTEPAPAPAPGEEAPAAAPPYEQPGPEGLSDIAKRLLDVSAEDVDYLRGEPYSTTQEQAMRERERARIRNEYDAARQRLIDTLGADQGFSGVLRGALERLGEHEAGKMAEVDRDVFIKAADEMRSRLAESRGVVGGLETLERQRMMESLGIQQAMDESERQRMLDLMAALGLAPQPGQMADVSRGILGYAGELGRQGAAMSQSNLQGIGTLADIFSKAGWLK